VVSSRYRHNPPSHSSTLLDKLIPVTVGGYDLCTAIIVAETILGLAWAPSHAETAFVTSVHGLSCEASYDDSAI